MKTLYPAALAVAMAVSSAANAAVVINPGGSVTVSGSGGNFSINFDGFGGDPPAVVSGLTSTIDFGFVNITNGGLTYNFTYNVNNTSSAPITGSRVSIFGFNTSPDIASATVAGIFNIAASGNVPNFGTVEICFKDGGGANCSGGGSGGVDIGNSGGGTFALTFANAPAGGSLTLSDFVDRYQSIAGAGAVTSAIGRQTTVVPEPETWAMMLGGFALAGLAMRRRRTRVLSFV